MTGRPPAVPFAAALVGAGLFTAPTASAAAFPDGQRAMLPWGSLGWVAPSDDGLFLAGLSTSGTLTVLDLRDPYGGETAVSTCGSPRSLAVADLGTGPAAYVGCDEGALEVVSVDTSIQPVAPATPTGLTVGEGLGEIVALVPDPGSGLLWVIEKQTSVYDAVHSFDPASSEVDTASGTPASVTHESASAVLDPSGTWLVVGGSDGHQTSFTVSAGAIYTGSTTVIYQGADLTAAVAFDSTTAYLLDGTNGALYALSPAGFGAYTTFATDLGPASALLAVTDDDGEDWLVVGEDDLALQVVSRVDGTVAEPLSVDSAAEDLAATPAGRWYAATSQGLAVLSASPWVQVESVSPEVITGDTDVEITFTSDEDGGYAVCFGSALEKADADCSGPAGDVSAGDAVAVPFEVSVLDEGTQWIAVFVTDSDGEVGHDAVSIEVDTPPDAVAGVSAGFGDRKVVLSFTRSDESDVVGYRVYFDDGPVSPSTGPPDFQFSDGGAGVSSPAWIDQPAAEGTVQFAIEPLENGVEHCAAVAAVDAAGAEGPWSESVCATPAPTGGWADSTDDTGCSSMPRGSAAEGIGALAGLAVARTLARRRRPPCS